MFSHKYDRTSNMQDLGLAVEHTKEAVQITSSADPDRASYLNNLGKYLYTGYEGTSEKDGLEQAIACIQEVILAISLDHPDRAMYLNNLGLRLNDRYSCT